MIRTYAHLDGWRRLLEEEIPREMAYYLAEVKGGTATDAWHEQARQQCSAWGKRIAAMLAHADLALFQGRNPMWTLAAVQAVQSDLATIASAIAAYAATPSATGALATLQAALAVSIATSD